MPKSVKEECEFDSKGEIFAEPFLQQLEHLAKQQTLTAHELIWHVLDGWLKKSGVKRPSDANSFELQETLFDVTRALNANVVGIRIPDRYHSRLTRLGVSAVQQELEFPTVAYRMGLIRSYLDTHHTRMQWPEILKLARKQILTPREAAAAEWAKRRAGMFLQPVMDQTGQASAGALEIQPLRTLLSEGIEERAEIAEMVQTYDASNRGKGIERDGQHVIRREIATARAMGAWTVEIGPLDDDTLLYRVPSSTACRGCLRLWLLPSGQPHLYTKAEFAAGEALGYNKGSWRGWHPVVSSTHPDCTCSPPQKYIPELAGVFTRHADRRKKVIEDLKVFAAPKR